LNKALEVAESIEDKGYKEWDLNGIALAMARLGEKTRATEILNKALAVAESIEDKGDKVRALDEIANAMAQVGDFDRALTVAEMIEAFSIKVGTLSNLSQATAKLEEKEKAVNKLNKTLPIWIAEVALKQSADRDYMFQVLVEMVGLYVKAAPIASIDRGQTLWKIYEAILEVDGWWSME